MGRNKIDRTAFGGAGRIERLGLPAETADRLRDMIVYGELAPGTRLGEQGLSDSLGVSRTPLREALNKLRHEGLVEFLPNRGAWVSPLDSAHIQALFETAAGLERMAAELAATRLAPDDLQALQALQDRIETAFAHGERLRYFALNQDIHRAIVAGAKNPVLIETHDWLFPRLERARYRALMVEARWRHSVDEHRAILAALAEKDARRAGDLLYDHVLATGTTIAAIVVDVII